MLCNDEANAVLIVSLEILDAPPGSGSSIQPDQFVRTEQSCFSAFAQAGQVEVLLHRKCQEAQSQFQSAVDGSRPSTCLKV